MLLILITRTRKMKHEEFCSHTSLLGIKMRLPVLLAAGRKFLIVVTVHLVCCFKLREAWYTSVFFPYCGGNFIPAALTWSLLRSSAISRTGCL